MRIRGYFFEARSVRITAVDCICLKKVTKRMFITRSYVKSIRDHSFVRTDCYKNISFSRVTDVKDRPVAYSRHENDQDNGVYPFDFFTYYGNMRPIILDTSPQVSYFFKCGTMRPVMESS